MDVKRETRKDWKLEWKMEKKSMIKVFLCIYRKAMIDLLFCPFGRGKTVDTKQ